MIPKKLIHLLLKKVEANLRQADKPLSEYELMQQVEPHWQNQLTFSSDLNLQLFQKHFLIMHLLYQLQTLLIGSSGEVLKISALEISIEPALESGQQTVSTETSESSLKAYYLDWLHYTEATGESVDKLLDSFWQRYFNQDQYIQALMELQLPETASLEEAQKQYRRLANIHHPDRGGDAEEFVKIQKAWEIIKG